MKIVRIQHAGNVGNRIFQYFFALRLQQRVTNSRIVGVNIPGWDLGAAAPADMPQQHILVEGGHEFNLDRIAYALNSHIADGVTCRVFAHRMEYLPELAVARSLLASGLQPQLGAKVPEDALLINIRGAEILGGLHKDYMPLPLSYYEALIGSTGLRPIFMGQLGDGTYFDVLRRAFPAAELWPSEGAVRDFNTIANARHIVVSVSSFSWLAAWLSPAAATIHLPLCGTLNPQQRPDIDLIPYPDPRYRYYQFPVIKWLASPAQVESLLAPDVQHVELVAEAVVALKLRGFRAC